MNRQGIARRLMLDLLGAGILLLSAVWMWFAPDQDLIAYLLQALGAGVVALGLVLSGLRDVFRKNATHYSDQLLAIAVLAACAYGDFVTATLVPLALDLGRLFEERTALGVHNTIQQMRDLQVDQVLCITETGEQEQRSIEDIQVGQRVCVRIGERIPVDGVVTQGQSSIDQAIMTGESMPTSISVGDSVFAGTTNLQGELIIETTTLGEDSALGRIIQLMEQAQESKPKLLQRIESWLGIYLPLTLAIAGTVLFVTEDIDRTIAILVVAFPSSLAIAGSATMVAAFSKAASMSLLFKDATVFQTLRDVGTIVFDKTGTLTVGSQRLEKLIPNQHCTEAELISAALQCAKHSNHPISQAIVRSVDQLNTSTPIKVEEFPGLGVQVITEGGEFRLGRLSWFQDLGLESAEITQSEGTWVAKDSMVLGSIQFSDTVRDNASCVLQKLNDCGVQTQLLLTGDQHSEAQRVSDMLGIQHVVSTALPEEKLTAIQHLRQTGHKVCMVGDGVNDALALQEADVGIAIGTSINQAAMGGADIALVSDNLERIADVFILAERVHSKIIQNVGLGFAFSLVMFSIVGTGQISALQAAVIHNAGALLVILNSSLLWRSST